MRLAPEDVQEFRFTIVKGAKPGSKMSFEGGGTRSIRIGRAVDNELVVNDPTVSRLHARIDIRQDGWFISDQGSSSGIEKMGFRVGSNAEPLDSGDEFRLGDTILKFEVVAKKGALKKAAAKAAAQAAGKEKALPGTAAPSLLARFGLGSRRTQLLAVAALVLVTAWMLWPEAPGLPPQAGDQPVNLDYAAAYGFFRNADKSHLDKAMVVIPSDAEGVGVYVDILGPSGVEIRAGTRPAVHLDPSPEWTSYQLVMIPRAVAKDKPRVTFDNLGYDAKQGDVDPSTVKEWGVWHLWLLRVPNASVSLDQLNEELRALRELNDRLKDNVSYRWAILSGLRRSLVGVMKLAGQPTALVPIPAPGKVPTADIGSAIDEVRGAVAAEQAPVALAKLVPLLGQLEGELNREYRKLMNTYTLAQKRSDPTTVGVTLATLGKLLPENTDPRHRLIVAEIRKLQGPAVTYYNDAFDRLGAAVSG
jgi:hypothetical protein